MKSILYIFKGKYPWDIRVDKFTKSFIEAGFQVVILSRWLSDLTETDKSENLIIKRVGFKLPSYFSLPVSNNPIWKKAIKNAIIEFTPSIIIARDIMLAEASADIGHKFKLPVLMDMAENYPAAMREWKKYNKTLTRRFIVHKLKIPDLFERNSVSKVDGIITVCQEQNQRLIDTYDYPKDKIVVVHNTPYKEFCENIRLGTAEPPMVFGHHGNMTAEKSVINFVKGFLIAAAQNKNIKLFLAGEGEDYDEVKKLVGESNYKERVVLTGEYKYDEIKKILSSIDIGVIPYQPNDFNNYTIHNKVFDFFAAGKPIIYSPCKPLIRLNQETDSGFILENTEPETISKMILKISESNPKKQAENSFNLFKNKYNWEIDSSNLLKFINSFIKND
ncbi:MAG: glycosyltransferase [Candidatus Kapabacteria bacterium]|nr:glycosyltransferase [Candidatus Kapabacteria bacterium]